MWWNRPRSVDSYMTFNRLWERARWHRPPVLVEFTPQYRKLADETARLKQELKELKRKERLQTRQQFWQRQRQKGK